MARVFLGLGSNIDPRHNLRLAIDELERRFGTLDVSPVYRSSAVGFEGPDFLNLVAALDSNLSPGEILGEIEAIHELAGRERDGDAFSSRPLDIDLLLYDDLVLDDGPVRLPRSDILEYAFVLRPLSVLAPDLVHPVTGRPMSAHWASFSAEPGALTPVDIEL